MWVKGPLLAVGQDQPALLALCGLNCCMCIHPCTLYSVCVCVWYVLQGISFAVNDYLKDFVSQHFHAVPLLSSANFPGPPLPYHALPSGLSNQHCFHAILPVPAGSSDNQTATTPSCASTHPGNLPSAFTTDCAGQDVCVPADFVPCSRLAPIKAQDPAAANWYPYCYCE